MQVKSRLLKKLPLETSLLAANKEVAVRAAKRIIWIFGIIDSIVNLQLKFLGMLDKHVLYALQQRIFEQIGTHWQPQLLQRLNWSKYIILLQGELILNAAAVRIPQVSDIDLSAFMG